MRHLALGFSLALSGLGFVAATSGAASACAMFRPMVVESAERLVADARKAETRGEVRSAIRLYERAMNDAGANKSVRVSAALKAGELQAREGRARESMRRFQKAVALDGARFEARLGYGKALAATGDLPSAQAELEAATRLPGASFTQRGDAQAALSTVFARQGRAAEAEAALQAARLLGARAESIAAAQSAAAPNPFPALAQQM